MNNQRRRELRKKGSDDEIVIVLKRDNATWLLGFFKILLATFQVGDLSSDTINAHEVVKALEKGFKDGTEEQSENTGKTAKQ